MNYRLLVLLLALWPLSLGLATLGERYVERPSAALGRRLTQRTPRRPRATTAIRGAVGEGA